MECQPGMWARSEDEESKLIVDLDAEAATAAIDAHINKGRRWRTLISVAVTLAFVSTLAVLSGSHSELIRSSFLDLQQKYLPAVHEKALDLAYEEAFRSSRHLIHLINTTEAMADKVTIGTCKHFNCKESRGPTDCLLNKCMCKYGYATKDGETCVPIKDVHAARDPLSARKTTKGRCWLMWWCSSSRGEVECQNTRCVCKSGFFSMDQETCTPITENAKKEYTYDLGKFMMGAGIVEPDELPCPGSTIEMGMQGVKMLAGKRKYDVSLCRMSIQVYHGSPLPLVYKDSLLQTPISNGDTSENNLGNKNELYALMTNRQWRTAMVQAMSKQFAYALVSPDVAESARRLGNLFHTLTDSWSASHVVRTPPDDDIGSDLSLCQKYVLGTAVSMDTVNWAVHAGADGQEDKLFECAQYYTRLGISLWAELRSEGPLTTVVAVNRGIDRLIKEVFCPSLNINWLDLDKPAGGATAKLSASWAHGKPEKPKGTAAEEDTIRIISKWDEQLESARDNAKQEEEDEELRFGINIFVSARGQDVCLWQDVAHVDDAFVKAVLDDASPNYIMPAPALHKGEILKTQEGEEAATTPMGRMKGGRGSRGPIPTDEDPMITILKGQGRKNV